MNNNEYVSIVVKNGKVDNLLTSFNESECINHAKSMVKCYENENISQIVVYKKYEKDKLERMYEYIP